MKPLDQIIDVRLLAPAATAIGICVTILLWFLNQRRKQLSYRILWQDAFTRAGSSIRERLDVRLDGKRIDHAGLLIVQIMNSGHLPITPGDFQSRLTISAGPGAKVLYADVASTSPGDLDERCRTPHGDKKSLIEGFHENEVVISPVLLNEGDSLTVQLLVENLRGGVRVGGHINGLRRISLWRPRTMLATLLTNLGALVMASAMLLVEPRAVFGFELADVLPQVLLFLFGYTLLSAGLYGRQRVLASAKSGAALQ